jgi:hypothetical protein
MVGVPALLITEALLLALSVKVILQGLFRLRHARGRQSEAS